MNKKFKNILIISIFIFVGCFSLYLISSCCVIFTDYNLDINHLLSNVFATRDAENFILFKSNYKGEYFDIFPKHQTVGKFSLLVEEMHRYHVNTYKNFKWNEWMYEGMELGIDLKK